uniref:Uncharacterized protein n=1 Tax=Helianthus annuus TaxID=4232 RepID=A0A251RQ17_HELAN
MKSIGLYLVEHAVWKAGEVMGRYTWNLNTNLMVMYTRFMIQLTNEICFRCIQ